MGENPKGISDEVLEGALGNNDSVFQATDKSSKRTSRKSSRVSLKGKMSPSADFLQAEAECAALKAKAQASEQKIKSREENACVRI